jgi:hypothetical protein
MKIDIKRKIRLNLPETNSSSSHSLVIGYSNHLKSKEDVLRELEPYIDDSGILRVARAEFGWENGKSNSVYYKLQYLMAISCSYHGCGYDEESFSDKVKVQKLLGIIERIVKEYTGLREVKFEMNGSGVDHQSVNLYTEIVETNLSIKQFLFSEQSWIFLGNDNSGPELGTLEMSEESYNYGLMTVHIPGSIGDIDFPILEPITNFYLYDSGDILRLSEDTFKILGNIVLVVNVDGTIESICDPSIMNQMNYLIKSTPSVALSKPEERYFTRKFVMKDGKWYLLWATADIMNDYDNLPISFFDEDKDSTNQREHYFDYDNLPKNKIVLVEVDLVLDAFGELNIL